MDLELIIIAIFCYVDDKVKDINRHPQSKLYPGELITLGLLFALKGGKYRRFYRWLKNNFLYLFPCLPEQSKLFRLLESHSDWCDKFLVEPTILNIIDTYGIEIIHPIREGRSDKQFGKKGKSNHRWIVGVKWAVIINQQGKIVLHDVKTANVCDNNFNSLVEEGIGERGITFGDAGFRSKNGLPPNLKICKRGEWNERMLIERLYSQVTQTCSLKKISHRVEKYIRARLQYVAALVNCLCDLSEQLFSNPLQSWLEFVL